MMTGPPSILVSSSSAMHGRSWENEAHHCSALKRSHSELVKFSRNDGDYERVLATLKRMASAAVLAIPRGMPSVGLNTVEEKMTLMAKGGHTWDQLLHDTSQTSSADQLAHLQQLRGAARMALSVNHGNVSNQVAHQQIHGNVNF